MRRTAEPGGEAPDTAAPESPPTPAGDRVFPVDFDEWAGRQAAAYRYLVAGFRAEMQAAGRRDAPRPAAEWDADFAAYQQRPVR